MSYIRWDPWKSIGFLQNRINQMIAESASDSRAEDELASADHIRAVLKDGVLEIRFPKPEEEKLRRIHVHVN